MAQSSSSTSAPSSSDEFIVRMPRDTRKKFTMMKFGSGSSVDFAKVGEQPVKIERENNLKQYKSANDIDLLPKFGAGSEYGRDLKEESRRKKYGIMLKKYNPDDQPWHLKIGAGKQAKKYKGVREGSISDNTSYYIFCKAADGAFEAFPVEEWYNFSPLIQKFLNSDEAEEEYNRRDKVLNHWMIKYKYQKGDEEGADDEGEKKKSGKKKSNKSLQLTDMEDWDDLEMSDEDSDRDSTEGKPNKKKKPQSKKKKGRNAKHNSDDEAIEESDEGEYDDKEVDYISDSGSDSSLSGGEQVDEKKSSKYDDKGVDQEEGLLKILDSDAEDEEEEEEKKEPEEETGEKDEGKVKKQKGLEDSSSSSSEDDSDIEKDAKLASEILLPGKKKEKKETIDDAAGPSFKPNLNPSSSNEKLKEKGTPLSAGIKRKAEKSPPDSKPQTMKKHRPDESEAALEEDLRRYLTRKPITTKELISKFKGRKLDMGKERITQVIAQLLKRINPDQIKRNGQLYLFLKQPE